jgi:hypothetical protein
MNMDELERRFVRAARHEMSPSGADVERNQAAVLERLAEPWGAAFASALGMPSHSARSSAPGVLVGAVHGSRLAMLAVGLVVGAVVGGWFGFGLGRSERYPHPPAAVTDALVVPPEAPSTPPAEGVAPTSVPEAPSAPRREAEPPAALEAPPPRADAVRRRGFATAPARAARRAPAAQAESSLAIELAMLQRARRALNAENARLALGIVQELDERFPGGVLDEERSATRISSLCQLGRVSEAKQAANDFLQRSPSSVYAERVRKSCASGSRD